MHNHNGKDSGNKGMLWMILPCLLMAGVLFFGGDKLSSNKYLWLVVLGACVVPHILMMRSGHANAAGEDRSDITVAKKPEAKDDGGKHGQGGCCH